MVPDYSTSGLKDLLSLNGRTAAVTGGASGIGEAICLRFAELGANLAIGDLDVGKAQKLAEELSGRYPIRAIAHALDVRESASVEAFADAAKNMSGTLDIWVNNAGIFPYNFIPEISDRIWNDVMEINLRGTFFGIKAAAARMAPADKSGHTAVIVNIASMTAVNGREGYAHYSSSKHGVVGLTKTAAREFGAKGIRVLAVAPTIVETPGTTARRNLDGGATSGPIDEMVRSRIPLGRVCVPDDIARVVALCASDATAMMTGSMLLVDAGFGTG